MGIAMGIAITAVLVMLPPWVFGAVVLLAAIAGAIEFQGITRADATMAERVIFTTAVVFVVAQPLIGAIRPAFTHSHALTIGFVALAVFRVFNPAPLAKSPPRLGLDLLGLLYIGLTYPFIYLTRDQPDGGWFVVLMMAITFGGDTGGYFAGRFLGRHKLYPLLSPKKTIEGAVGGVVLGIGAAFLGRAFFPGLEALRPVDCVALGVGGAVLGIIGDLFESMLKRAYGVKDASNLIPGHGGILDRIDGLLFSGPFIYFYLGAVL